jgi:multiple sugar transport system substrate-binding protein
MNRPKSTLGALAAASLFAGSFASSPVQAQEITVWSHWAAEQIKRQYVEDAAKRFEQSRPGVKVKITFYEKSALYAALKTALRAGQAPDVFYAEPDQTDYIENGFLADLSQGVNWNAVEPWAREVWTSGKGVYGLPLEAWTIETYYNKKLLSDVGMTLPSIEQFTEDQFVDMVKKARAKGLTAMAQGVGDRPFPGSFVTHEALLKKLGPTEYDALLKGQRSWSDPKVVEVLNWVESLVKAGAFPPSFTSIKLGEAHTYFHTNPGAVTLQMGSFYTSRAFNAPDKGGQPANFPLGIMKAPSMKNGVCNECKTIAVGGSYVVNAGSKEIPTAKAFLNSLANPEMANRWLETVLVQTGIKSDPSKISGPHAAYFKQLAAANQGARYYFGLPTQIMQGKGKEVFVQVINNALPAGTISPAEAIKQLDAARR